METSFNITNARAELYKIVEAVNMNHEPVHITTKNGKDAILIAESDWKAIQETLYLNSIPDLTNRILESETENIDDMINAEELEW